MLYFINLTENQILEIDTVYFKYLLKLMKQQAETKQKPSRNQAETKDKEYGTSSFLTLLLGRRENDSQTFDPLCVEPLAMSGVSLYQHHGWEEHRYS